MCAVVVRGRRRSHTKVGKKVGEREVIDKERLKSMRDIEKLDHILSIHTAVVPPYV